MLDELLFYNQQEWDSIKRLFGTKNYKIISLSNFIEEEFSNNIYKQYEQGIFVIDVSTLYGAYRELRFIQFFGERIFRRFSNEELIFICEDTYLEDVRFKLRFCFRKFTDIKTKYKADLDVLPNKLQLPHNKHKKITDLSSIEFEDFFNSFRNSLYGHEKFKDDFYEIAKSFRLFNKIGEHKILSLFLLGESGVGKTEVARAIYKSLGGKGNLAKINFGNYSNEYSLSSLIGSARGYIGSEDGEIFMRVRNTDIGIILIDEFEKSNTTLFNFFLDVLESGKMVSSQGVDIDINGFIIIFTSNISKEEFPTRISPELRSRFDYKGHFTRLYNEDKKRYVASRIKSIVKKYNQEIDDKLDSEEVAQYFIKIIPVEKYDNMRDLNKKIKMDFVKYIETHKPDNLPRKRILELLNRLIPKDHNI